MVALALKSPPVVERWMPVPTRVPSVLAAALSRSPLTVMPAVAVPVTKSG